MDADENLALAIKALSYPRWADETFSAWRTRYGLIYPDALARFIFGMAPTVPDGTARPA